MMKCIITIACLLFCCTARAQWTEQDQLEDCNVGKAAALADIASGKIKYYAMGMGMPHLANYFRREHFGLKVEMIGCIVEDNMICYNQAVDSFFRTALKKDMEAELKRKTDSFEASVPRSKLPQLYNSMGMDYFGEENVYEATEELRMAFIRRVYGD